MIQQPGMTQQPQGFQSVGLMQPGQANQMNPDQDTLEHVYVYLSNGPICFMVLAGIVFVLSFVLVILE